MNKYLIQIYDVMNICGLFVLFVFRALNAALIQSSFVPDEYWQACEVAHRIVFGFGVLTWEWIVGLRSVLFPAVFALGYLPLRLTGTDTAYSLALTTNFVQICIAVIGDVFSLQLATRVLGRRAAPYAFFCRALCWFHLYTCTRTLVTSMEEVLITISAARWPLSMGRGDVPAAGSLGLVCAALACIIRPPCAIFFCSLTILTLARRSVQDIMTFCRKAFTAATPVVLLSTLADRWFYGAWVFPMWTFFRFNVLEDIASEYGTHAWSWYLTSALPTVLAVFTPLTLHGLLATRSFSSLVLSAGFYLLALMTSPHKELRFMSGLLPVALCCAGYSLHLLARTHWRTHIFILVMAAIVHVFAALYFGLVHNRGVMDAIYFLARDVDTGSRVVFLTPCHATPLYSHIHANISVDYLHCETVPSLRNDEWEFSSFIHNPNQWLQSHMAILPSHIVIFAGVLSLIQDWVVVNNFTIAADYFHTHFPEGDVSSHILVLKQQQH